ncbi:Uma2 family endonuclease [Lusitaniella coriacea LEGE 07157]|uniref:Uma2 family endonuclease n=1 Tax=Lusitaniella coriacea LEGE 07157 TaxID=945747 RepID=A0A8J7IXK5_9CYAN|nr:Uma2 family endonuclease [Lusitaniella coriacea]MBE9118817.1 Uma2 family endonuclease [Lusitaniella coriacea LEGE 07157]
MVQSQLTQDLPSGDELPFSDGLPVDNELHILVPNLLSFILGFLWSERLDWFFGINMGIYYATGVNPRVPIVSDAFLSFGVERLKASGLRNSYVVWEEKGIVPSFVLEVVSKTPGGEYDEKMVKYAQLGALYYLIYNPTFWQRDRREPFEVYRLIEGEYQRQLGEPFWMPELGLGIGRGVGTHQGLQREWLYWYDEQGNRLESPEDRATRLQEILERYRQQFGDLPQ